ncbi:hypothetical protein NQD34_001070, partial [Periophthalmus magnuspinnatus]
MRRVSTGSWIHNSNSYFSNSGCESHLNFHSHREFVYVASAGRGLSLACFVQLCDSTTPSVTWFKLTTDLTSVNLSEGVTTRWTCTQENAGVVFLNFQNVQSKDSGLYQCQSGSNWSHIIKLVVGGSLNISCRETACNNSAPTVTWFKNETRGLVPVNVSDRVTTEWTRTNNYELISFLIFHKVVNGDSG